MKSSLTLVEVKDLYVQGLFEKVIRSVQDTAAVTAEMLTYKAMSLQLIEDDGSLEEVTETFQDALRLNPNNVFALVQYGWFLQNVMDKQADAREVFLRALSELTELATDVVHGLLENETFTLEPRLWDRRPAKYRYMLVDKEKIRTRRNN